MARWQILFFVCGSDDDRTFLCCQRSGSWSAPMDKSQSYSLLSIGWSSNHNEKKVKVKKSTNSLSILRHRLSPPTSRVFKSSRQIWWSAGFFDSHRSEHPRATGENIERHSSIPKSPLLLQFIHKRKLNRDRSDHTLPTSWNKFARLTWRHSKFGLCSRARVSLCLSKNNNKPGLC